MSAQFRASLKHSSTSPGAEIEATGMSGDLDHRNIRQGRQDRVNREKRPGAARSGEDVRRWPERVMSGSAGHLLWG